MEYFFAKLKYSIEKDPVTTFFAILVIVLIILGIWLYRSRTKNNRTPDLLDHDGYYKVALTSTGYAVTGRNTLGTFYYLRKDPFDTEVIIDRIYADNGKSYSARAVVTSVLPEEMINNVCRRYFSGETATENAGILKFNKTDKKETLSAEEILYGSQKKEKLSSDELFLQAINSSASQGLRSEAYIRSAQARSKNNCDAEIDMDLTIAFSSALKKLVIQKGGTQTEEEIKKLFLGQAMLSAMNYGHTVMAVPVFNITEIDG